MRISELEAPNDLWSFPPLILLALSILIKTVFISVRRLQSRIQASEPRDSQRDFSWRTAQGPFADSSLLRIPRSSCLPSSGQSSLIVVNYFASSVIRILLRDLIVKGATSRLDSGGNTTRQWSASKTNRWAPKNKQANGQAKTMSLVQANEATSPGCVSRQGTLGNITAAGDYSMTMSFSCPCTTEKVTNEAAQGSKARPMSFHNHEGTLTPGDLDNHGRGIKAPVSRPHFSAA